MGNPMERHWSDTRRVTFCEGISYSADCDAEAESTCFRSLARSDQAARRKPAGTESQVEPTTGAQSRIPQIRALQRLAGAVDVGLVAVDSRGCRFSRDPVDVCPCLAL